MFQVNDVGIPATAEQVGNEAPAAPAIFPLPVVMVLFLALGYFMLRQVWKA